MKRLLKILLGLIITVVLLMVAAGVLLPMIYDEDDLKAAIASEVHERTGRTLRIDGELDFSVFPWIAMEVTDLSISNAPGFGDQPQAEIGTARVGVALMPLFRKQISVDTITLDGLNLVLAVKANGQNNWDDLSAGDATPEAEDTGPGMFSSKRVAGLDIRDANVEYIDQQSGSHYRMSEFSLVTGALGDGEAVPMELKTRLDDVKAGTSTEAQITAIAAINLETERHTLADFVLTLALEAAEQSREIRILSPLLDLDAGNERLQLDTFRMELDDAVFNGELGLRNFSLPDIEFKLAADEFNLDRLLESTGGESTGGAGAVSEDVVIPAAELRGFKANGLLTIGRLRMAGMDFSDATVGIAVDQGRLRLNPLTAGFYGGTYSGDVRLDGSGAVPVLSLNEQIDSIAFQQLVADLVESESLSGTALGHVRLSGRGKTDRDMISSLQGDVELALVEGALEGINIWYEIRRGMALFKGLPAPEAEPRRTVFSRMQMSGSVADGVVTTRELAGELPFLTIQGNGAIDLAGSQVDLGLVAEVRSSPELSQDPLGAELSGKSLPFKITGPLDAPKLSVDWEGLLKSEATGILLKKIGLGSKEAESKPDESSAEQEEQSSEDQLKETAKGALFELLRKKDEDQDKDAESN